jgi:hypothetical protein
VAYCFWARGITLWCTAVDACQQPAAQRKQRILRLQDHIVPNGQLHTVNTGFVPVVAENLRGPSTIQHSRREEGCTAGIPSPGCVSQIDIAME